MRPDIRKELAVKLAEEIGELESSVRTLEKILEPKEGDCGIGRMINPDAVPGHAATLETLRLERERLRRLEAARGRLDDSDFGICRGCGKAIQAERLLLVPETRLCMTCKGGGSR